MNIRLTQENASKYIGYKIRFKTDGKFIDKIILGVSRTSVRIDYPRLNNSATISRRIFVITTNN
jgi:hypothetical protein